jgi:hypothetical protein
MADEPCSDVVDPFDEDMGTVRAWLAAGAPRSVFLAVGVPGCGVSTALTGMLAAMAIESVWLDPATPRLRVALADAGCSCVSATGRRKVVVVDGFDAIMRDANGAADISDALRRQLPAPTVFLAHRTRTVVRRFRDLFPAATRDRATVLEVRPMSPARIAGMLRERHPGVAPALAESMARACRGDVRSALASLALSDSTDAYVKDEVPEADAVVEEALAGAMTTVAGALARGASDPAVVSHGIFERYGFSPEVADALSIADVMEERMFSTQRWELADVHAAMAVAYPAVRLQPSQVLPPPRPQPGGARTFVYGMVWSRQHLLAARTKLFHTVQTQRVAAKLPAMGVADLAMVRRMVTDATDRPAVLRRVLEGLQPGAVLAIMRLWKGSYTLGMHAKVSRLITQKENGA